MIVSKIIRNNIAYYNLPAEECFVNKEAFYMNSISVSSIEKVFDDIVADRQNSTFVLDFQESEISLAGKQTIDKKLPDLKISRTIILANILKRTVDSVGSLKMFADSNQLSNNKYSYFTFSQYDCNSLELSNIFENELLEKLIIHKRPNTIEKQYHESSSVYLPTYINIKGFMTKDKPFFLYTIYQLAQQIKQYPKWSDYFSQKETKKPILICQSLNGSCIASVLSDLLNTGIFIFEQIGPINRLNRNIGHVIESGEKYIIVSDVVCLGTEVKIAKSIINYFGGNCLGNVSIVQFQNESTTKKGVSTFTITRDNCDDLGFNILTGLNIEKNGKE